MLIVGDRIITEPKTAKDKITEAEDPKQKRKDNEADQFKSNRLPNSLSKGIQQHRISPNMKLTATSDYSDFKERPIKSDIALRTLLLAKRIL